MPLRALAQPAQTTELDVKALRTFLEQLNTLAPLNGQVFTCEIAAGDASVDVPHSFGRAYLGGFVQGVSAGAAVHVQTPEAAAAFVDVKKLARVVAPANLAVTTTIKIWLY